MEEYKRTVGGELVAKRRLRLRKSVGQSFSGSSLFLIHVKEQSTGKPWKPQEHPIKEPKEVAGKEYCQHVGRPAVGQKVRQQCQQGDDEQAFVTASYPWHGFGQAVVILGYIVGCFVHGIPATTVQIVVCFIEQRRVPADECHQMNGLKYGNRFAPRRECCIEGTQHGQGQQTEQIVFMTGDSVVAQPQQHPGMCREEQGEASRDERRCPALRTTPVGGGCRT